MMFKWGMILATALTLSACLKTRSDVGEYGQSQVYSKKNADIQKQSQVEVLQTQTQSNQTTPVVDERDELIRTLNGRVESLENQISNLSKDKTEQSTAESQRVQLLQEALTKMEAQIQRLEAERLASVPPTETVTRPSGARVAAPVGSNPADKNVVPPASALNATAYEIAQDHFSKKEWKKAIFNYQKYVDEAPKGKNVADAKYKIGVCFQELGMKEEAMAFYEEVIANYAKTETGKKAKLRLAKLKK